MVPLGLARAAVFLTTSVATAENAERHGVSGWVRNRADGTVEAEVEGAPEDVELVTRWFAHGPPDARVDRLEVSDDLAPTGDGEVLTTMLDRVEQIGEVPGRVGRADLSHGNQII